MSSLNSIVRRLALAALALLLLTGAGAPQASASPTGATEMRDAYSGRPRFSVIKRFGNRKKLAKRIDPRCARTDGRRYYESEIASGRSKIVGIRRFGNQKRIARLIDATGTTEPGDVVLHADPVGRPRLVKYKRFGNRKRIARATGLGRK